MKAKYILIIFVLATSLSACNFNIGEKGNGNVVREQRNLDQSFDKISSSAGTGVYITQGDTNQIIVETDDNLLQYIKTNISNGELKISTSNGMGRATKRKVYITFKEINTLSASSGSKIAAESLIKSEMLSIRASSGANISAEVFSRNLTARSSSGSRIKLKGKASSFTAKASSGSDISARDLDVITATAEASSGADIKLNVKEELEANASSGASIRYSGDPKTINSNKSRSGSVKKM